MKITATLAVSVCFLAGNAAGAVFAQVGEMGVAPGWISVIVQLGSFGLIGYLIVQGLPKLQADIMAERKAERADFVATIAAVTESARKETEAVRVAAKEEIESLRALFTEEQRETRAAYAKESAELRKLYVDAIGAFRTAVHEVRDAAGTAVNRATVAAELAKAATQRPPGV